MQKDRKTVCERKTGIERKDILPFMKTHTFVSVFQKSLHVPAGEIKFKENCKAPVKAEKR